MKHSWFRKAVFAVIFWPLLSLAGVCFAQSYQLTIQLEDEQQNLLEERGKVLVIGMDSILIEGTGVFQYELPQGEYAIEVELVHHKNLRTSLFFNRDTTLLLSPEQEGYWLEEVRIEKLRHRVYLRSIDVGKIDLEIDQVRKLPGLLGEPDLFRAVQMLPGVQASNEGLAGFHVRGGDRSQNLYLYDGVPIFNPSHMVGFFSAFNPDVVQSLELFKGPYPAGFGGRAASVLDIRPMEPEDSLMGSLAVGLLGARGLVAGTWAKKKGHFFIAGRLPFTGLLASSINTGRGAESDATPLPVAHFHDLNARISLAVGARDEFHVSGYWGRDQVKIAAFPAWAFDYRADWGNSMVKIGWKRVWSEKVLSESSIYRSTYDYELGNETGDYRLDLGSSLKEWGIRNNNTWFPGTKHRVNWGVESAFRTIAPRNVSLYLAGFGSSEFKDELQQGLESGLFLSDEFTVGDRLGVSTGLRWSSWLTREGSFSCLEPRASFNWKIGNNWAVKGGVGRAAQYLFQVSSSQLGLPIDVWSGSGDELGPQISYQSSLGAVYASDKKPLMIGLDFFARRFEGQVQFEEGAPLFGIGEVAPLLTSGRTDAVGAELLSRIRLERFSAQLAYTLSFVENTFPQKNNGLPFPARYDQRHVVQLAMSYSLAPNWELSANFAFKSGALFSLPAGRYQLLDAFPSGPVSVLWYTSLNSFRMPNYHRADLGVTYRFPKGRVRKELQFSIYNVYNRKNPFLVFLQGNYALDGTLTDYELRSFTLFPVLPSVNFQCWF